jgi:RNA polymerase sigma-70 factor (ECF subfamily)
MGDLETYCSALMRRANRGDAAAYRFLLQELASILKRSASRHRSKCTLEDIEDAVQEALLALHLKRHTWNESRPLLPWVRAILKNKVTDVLRRRGDCVQLSVDEVAETLADAPIAIASRIDAELVLASLKGRQRDVVVSMSVEGASARQVGARLGMTEVAVRVCLHRALKAMARTFRSDAASMSKSEHQVGPMPAPRGTLPRNASSSLSPLGHSMGVLPA